MTGGRRCSNWSMSRRAREGEGKGAAHGTGEKEAWETAEDTNKIRPGLLLHYFHRLLTQVVKGRCRRGEGPEEL
jgi:hypothetical protein